jgi:hypothetical protein
MCGLVTETIDTKNMLIGSAPVTETIDVKTIVARLFPTRPADTRLAARRSQARLEARRDRRCKNCGQVFTPKNSLGKTCSTRCRVALHRKKSGELRKRSTCSCPRPGRAA